jgi:hypothetical protein
MLGFRAIHQGDQRAAHQAGTFKNVVDQLFEEGNFLTWQFEQILTLFYLLDQAGDVWLCLLSITVV